MKVCELIDRLRELPQDAPVMFAWDGCCRSSAELVWLARGGHVAIADHDDVIYEDSDRPADAPLASVDPYWSVRLVRDGDSGEG